MNSEDLRSLGLLARTTYNKLTKKELALDILATTLMDALALAGIVSVVPQAEHDLSGTIAVILIFVFLGAVYTGIVIGEDYKSLRRG